MISRARRCIIRIAQQLSSHGGDDHISFGKLLLDILDLYVIVDRDSIIFIIVPDKLGDLPRVQVVVPPIILDLKVNHV